MLTNANLKQELKGNAVYSIFNLTIPHGVAVLGDFDVGGEKQRVEYKEV